MGLHLPKSRPASEERWAGERVSAAALAGRQASGGLRSGQRWQRWGRWAEVSPVCGKVAGL